jgi:conjugal transfer pilus assembly protein TraD
VVSIDYGLGMSLTINFSLVSDLHVDESDEVIGNEFVPILNKARGVGFQVATHTQTLFDIKARLGLAAKTGQVLWMFTLQGHVPK